MNPTISQLIVLNSTINKALGHPCWIAGGALRDIYHSKPVKDIDVFMTSPPSWHGMQKLYEAIRGHQTWDRERKGVDYYTPDGCLPGTWSRDEEAGYGGSEEGFRVYSGGPRWMGLDIQLVYTGWGRFDDIAEIVDEDFDIDLCRIYLRGSKLVCTPEFTRDSQNHTITVTRSMLHEGGDHLERLTAKFPGWKVRYAKEYVPKFPFTGTTTGRISSGKWEGHQLEKAIEPSKREWEREYLLDETKPRKFEVGSKVRIVKKIQDECNFDIPWWAPEMDATLRKVGRVVRYHSGMPWVYVEVADGDGWFYAEASLVQAPIWA